MYSRVQKWIKFNPYSVGIDVRRQNLLSVYTSDYDV